MNNKYELLIKYLSALGSVAVAFSGGADSTLLLAAAYDALGENALAITAVSQVFPEFEKNEAEAFCTERGINQLILDFDVFATDGFSGNPKDRCYLCKTRLFRLIRQKAAELGIKHIVEGSNVDDLSDYRPGMRALKEQGIISPLREVGLTKAEIYRISEGIGLPTAGKPSSACLASRIAYGEVITENKLRMVEAAERFLTETGFTQSRVRMHGMMARIEIMPEQMTMAVLHRELIYETLKSLGFTYVSLDLKGYRTGSMNEVIYE